MLSKVIKEDYIQLDVEANDFPDAISQALEPLVEDDAATQEYVDAVIKIYQETGPYIVITKNVALPHAPVSEGAKKVAIGFTRLKNAIVSGYECNDPVKYLFPLSAKDSQSHIELLSELADLLGDPVFIEFLENVSSKEEFINYLKKYEGDQKNEKS
ncbi:PTS sugar transporter subunit IIA [Enterococcus viikkiensis]|uniref:Ascorbate-specific PTS system EIIA component n=1 Tax=Enterococcus viikkiensis TaxID=930854 RepID=A0ABU3FRV9_9ENTE|nr:PTS sugar transporter subunit IIA [Enterococcus viikkiensis]MDT2828723.1 PTS sugar transporter subunit IIA [Enterococcus viikkiensis]